MLAASVKRRHRLPLPGVLETSYVGQRLCALRLSPAYPASGGRFDSQPLKDLNRRLFQDLPVLGFKVVTAGQFRPPTPAGQDYPCAGNGLSPLHRGLFPHEP